MLLSVSLPGWFKLKKNDVAVVGAVAAGQSDAARPQIQINLSEAPVFKFSVEDIFTRRSPATAFEPYYVR